MKIDILLSTYNGAAFLEELLQSLYAQTFTDWHLLIRDDGSEDNTPQLLENYREKDRNRITFITDGDKQLGPKRSFEKLLQQSEADYILFCDQDDVWLPNKIVHTLKKMQELESKNPHTPALVFSDLTVTDNNLQIVHPSLWKFTKVNPENINNIYKLIINNPVVGCTVMINKKLKEQALPFPAGVIMHDLWLAITAAANGEIVYLNEPAVLYRIHSNNTIGASRTDKKYYLKRLKNLHLTMLQNRNAIKMLRFQDKNFNIGKFMYYKILVTFNKLFRI